MTITIEDTKYLYISETEISLEAVKILVEQEFNEKYSIVSDKATGLNVIIPETLGVTEVKETFSEESGLIVLDSNGNDISNHVKVVCFDDDLNERGNYFVGGIKNGVLTIIGRDMLNEDDIERLVAIEYEL